MMITLHLFSVKKQLTFSCQILLPLCNHLLFYSIVLCVILSVFTIRVNGTIVALIKQVLVFLIHFLMQVFLLCKGNKVSF